VFVFFSFSAVIIPFKDRLNGVRFLVFKGEKWRFLPRSPRSSLGFSRRGYYHHGAWMHLLPTSIPQPFLRWT
jgi:hypothetical protein